MRRPRRITGTWQRHRPGASSARGPPAMPHCGHAVGPSAISAPHMAQKMSCRAATCPFGQCRESSMSWPHLGQKRSPSETLCPFRHFTLGQYRRDEGLRLTATAATRSPVASRTRPVSITYGFALGESRRGPRVVDDTSCSRTVSLYRPVHHADPWWGSVRTSTTSATHDYPGWSWQSRSVRRFVGASLKLVVKSCDLLSVGAARSTQAKRRVIEQSLEVVSGPSDRSL